MDNEIRELLTQAGMDVDMALHRFLDNDILLLKLVAKFNQEPSYNSMLSAIENEEWDSAYTHAHALKGVAGNFSFDSLYEDLKIMNESLKNHQYDEVTNVLPRVKEDYHRITSVMDTINVN